LKQQIQNCIAGQYTISIITYTFPNVGYHFNIFGVDGCVQIDDLLLLLLLLLLLYLLLSMLLLYLY